MSLKELSTFHNFSQTTISEPNIVHVYFFKHKKKWFLFCFSQNYSDTDWRQVTKRYYKTCRPFESHYPLYARLPQDHAVVFRCDRGESRVQTAAVRPTLWGEAEEPSKGVPGESTAGLSPVKNSRQRGPSAIKVSPPRTGGSLSHGHLTGRFSCGSVFYCPSSTLWNQGCRMFAETSRADQNINSDP